MNTPMTGDPDPWLREALRHAPDSDLVVPAGVREGILRAAREAAAPAARPWWSALADAWLRPARLGYSGAFMALLVLGIWGLDRLGPETGQPPVPADAVTTAALPATAPAGDPTSTRAAPEPRVVATRRESAGPSPAISAKTQPSAGAKPPSRAAAADGPVTSLESPAPAVPAVIAALPATPPAPAPTRAVMPPTQPAADTVSASAPALPPAEAPSSPTAVRIAALARTNMSPPAMTAPRAEAASDATLPQDRVQLRAAAAPAAADPVGLLLRRLAAEPAGAELRWSSPGHEAAHAGVQAEWLRLLQVETAGRWQRVTTADAPASSLRLFLRLAPLASFAFTSAPTSAWLTIAGTTYRAPLSEAAAARLETQRAGW